MTRRRRSFYLERRFRIEDSAMEPVDASQHFDANAVTLTPVVPFLVTAGELSDRKTNRRQLRLKAKGK